MSEAPKTLVLTSEAFQDGQPIPKQYTGDGDDVSPPLKWREVPSGTESLALVCDDPDAPTSEPFVHWVIYDIPADADGLPTGLPPQTALDKPEGAKQGRNSFDKVGYGGPAPPKGHGVHHYHFALYALDTELALGPGATKAQVMHAMEGHVLAAGELVGTYER